MILTLSLQSAVNCIIEILEQVSLRGKLVWLKYVHNTILLSLLIWIVYLELVVFRWNSAIKFILLYLEIWRLEANAIPSEHLEQCQNLYYFVSSKVMLPK